MKRYIKSFTADQLKQQLGDNYPESGYLYIFKHGIGPGTIPSDVHVVKIKDLPNYYTAVWLDRFLTTSELKQYDIPDETRINELLDRIGYCQKDGDVVPCNEIEACGDIKASKTYHFSRYNGESYTTKPDGTKVLSRKVLQRNVLDMLEDNDKYMNLDFCDAEEITEKATAEELLAIYDEEMTSEEFEALYNRVFGVDACDDITASKKIFASKMSDIDLLMKEALKCTTKDELGAVISGLDSLGFRKLFLHYMELLQDDSLSVAYIASELSDELYNKFKDIESCDKVTASTQELPTLREFNTAEWEELNDGSKRLQLGDLFVYFGTNKQWNASNPVYWYEIKINGETVKESREYPVDNNGREKCYKAMQKAIAKLLDDDIHACDKVTASSNSHPKIPDGWERVSEGDDEDGNWTTISKELPNNDGYCWIDLYENDNGKKYYEIQVGYRNSDGSIGDTSSWSSKQFYRLGDAVKFAEDKISRLYTEDVDASSKIESRTLDKWNHNTEEYEPVEIPDDWNVKMYSEDMDEIINCPNCGKEFPYGEGYTSRRYHNKYGMGYMECEDCYYEQLNDEFGDKDVNACDKVEASDIGSKYFANMVNASSDYFSDSYGYLIQGYYDGDKRGLAEDEWADTLIDANEIVNEYANKGYFIVVHNNLAGTVLEFPADAWFDEGNLNMELRDF